MRLTQILLTIAATTLAFIAPASAADNADSALLGFSPDGRYFAFEEYGVQDGSGFPFSSIYVIDTTSDQWVSGTPIRVLSKDETATLATTRSQARQMADPILTQRQVGAPGTTVVHNPLTETSADPLFVSFRPRSLSLPSSDEDYELRLEEYEAPTAFDCPDLDLGMPFQGFRLSLTDPQGQVRILSQDDRIPRSRGCPFHYRLSEVVVFFRPDGQPVVAILISVFSFGFEGLDRRFVAVTASLD